MTALDFPSRQPDGAANGYILSASQMSEQSMSLILYGIKTCDTVRKARKALEAAGKDVTFVDVRVDGLQPETIAGWFAAVGAERLINTRGTTWRNLAADERTAALSNPVDAIASNPTLFKRPVIVGSDNKVTVGWTKAEQALWLGDAA